MRCTISRRFGIIKSMGIRGAVDVTVDPSGNFQVCDVAVCGRVLMCRFGKCSACVSATVDSESNGECIWRPLHREGVLHRRCDSDDSSKWILGTTRVAEGVLNLLVDLTTCRGPTVALLCDRTHGRF